MGSGIARLIARLLLAGGSDLFLRGRFLWVRTPEGVVPVEAIEGVEREEIREFLELFYAEGTVPQDLRASLEGRRRVDFAMVLPLEVADGRGGYPLRLRVHGYYAGGEPAYALRIIPPTPTDPVDLGLHPMVVAQLTARRSGLFLVTGPTGSGKTTTLAAVLQKLARHYPIHILTFEDPIEYVLRPGPALVSQRELGRDFPSFPEGLNSALRESPDVVMVGEVRDLDTLRWTLSLAEAGFSVYATYHTRRPQETVERIIGSFPEAEGNQVRLRLAAVLNVVVSQLLLPATKSRPEGVKPRVLAYEALWVGDAVRTLIREGKTQQITPLLSQEQHGMPFERSLATLVRTGSLDYGLARGVAFSPDYLQSLLRG